MWHRQCSTAPHRAAEHQPALIATVSARRDFSTRISTQAASRIRPRAAKTLAPQGTREYSPSRTDRAFQAGHAVSITVARSQVSDPGQSRFFDVRLSDRIRVDVAVMPHTCHTEASGSIVDALSEVPMILRGCRESADELRGRVVWLAGTERPACHRPVVYANIHRVLGDHPG